MYKHVVLILFNAAHCLCSAEFEMFQGFEDDTLASPATVPDDAMPPWLRDYEHTETTSTTTTTTTTASPRSTTTTTEEPPSFACPEDEKPSNIGPYEVPTEKDLVLLVRKALVKRFQRYNRKTLILLRHIKEATKAAKLQVKKCQGKQEEYRICLREVNRHGTSITKNMLTTVEEHKRNITFFVKGKICNMAAMKPNPLMLVKKLAVEEAGLKFALPAYLRMLNNCHNIHCKNIFSKSAAEKPRRHLSDPEFLVKHFLTNNTLDLIRDLK